MLSSSPLFLNDSQVDLPSKRDYVRLTPDPGALELPDDDGANSGIPEEEDGSGSYN